MDEVNIHIDELVVGPGADVQGQLWAAAGDRLDLGASRQVADQISAAVDLSVGR